MPQVGVRLGGGSIARRLEAEPSVVDCLELAADDFFSRPTPYLTWLGRRLPLIVRASSLSIGAPGPPDPVTLASLADVSACADARFTVHPLGFSIAGEIRLGTSVPTTLTPNALRLVAQNVLEATRRCGRPALVEPITAPLRVPGSMAEPDFLARLCREAGCQLLIDVSSLVVGSRNHGFDPSAWLRAIPAELIAAARIGGSSFRDRRWHHDPRGDIDERAWSLMAELAARARPDVLLLGHRDRAGGMDELRHDLDRLRAIHTEARAPGGSSTPAGQPSSAPPSARPARAHDASDLPISIGRVECPVPAPDVALFVLDDAGVFFSESRRELSSFNTAATLVWCLIEEGHSIREITEAYRSASGLAESEAARHVCTIVQRWFGLGYITHPGPPGGDEVPLTTALAQILTNPRLRAQFRQSPQDIAVALGVAREDMDALTRLDADELDAQAEEVARLREARRRQRGTDAAGNPAPDRHVDSARERRYRLLTTTFGIRVDSAALGDRIHDALAHLERPDQEPDVVFDVRPSGSDGWVVFDADLSVAECRKPEHVVPIVKQLLRETAAERHDHLVRVHAAVVSFGQGCALLPAAAGSGKTTLTAGLIRAGATYFSDEVALLDLDTLGVRPVPLALTIKEGSVEPLRPLYPDIDALTPHVREDFVRVRYLPPPATALPADDGPQPVRWIIFPRYDATAVTRLRPLDRPTALSRLLDESVVQMERLDRDRVESLVRWMRTVACFEVPVSSLDTAVDLVRALLRGGTAT